MDGQLLTQRRECCSRWMSFQSAQCSSLRLDNPTAKASAWDSAFPVELEPALYVLTEGCIVAWRTLLHCAFQNCCWAPNSKNACRLLNKAFSSLPPGWGALVRGDTSGRSWFIYCNPMHSTQVAGLHSHLPKNNVKVSPSTAAALAPGTSAWQIARCIRLSFIPGSFLFSYQHHTFSCCSISCCARGVEISDSNGVFVCFFLQSLSVFVSRVLQLWCLNVHTHSRLLCLGDFPGGPVVKTPCF